MRKEYGASRYRRTKLDWFGVIAMFLLLGSSLAIFARLMATKMLTTTNMVLAMAALLVVNGLHIFVQLPLRRNKLGKLLCGVVAVLLSAAMIYGTVAAGAVQAALNKIPLRRAGRPGHGEHPADPGSIEQEHGAGEDPRL